MGNIKSYGEGVVFKILLLLFFLLIISFIISPKFYFQKTNYQSGDVIKHDILAERDILLEDKVSTELKKKQQLSTLGQVFDYDPKIYQNTSSLIQSSFLDARKGFLEIQQEKEKIEKINQDLGQRYFNASFNSAVIKKDIDFYANLKLLIQSSLEVLPRGAQFQRTYFVQKKKLDNDFHVIRALLIEYKKKQKIYEKQTQSLQQQIKQQRLAEEKIVRTLSEKREQTIIAFEKKLLLKFSAEDKNLFKIAFFSTKSESQLINILKGALSQQIILSKEIIQPKQGKSEIRNIVTNDKTTLKNLKVIKDVEAIRQGIQSNTGKLFFENKNPQLRNIFITTAKKLIRPNVTENKLEFEKKKDDIIKKFPIVYINLKQGEILARRGERVTSQQVVVINSYNTAISNVGKIPQVFGYSFIVFLSFLLLYRSVLHSKFSRTDYLNKLILISIVIIITLSVMKLGLVISETMDNSYTIISTNIYVYAFPVALGGMLIGILINFEVGVLASVIISFFAAIILQADLNYFLFSLVGNLVAAKPMTSFTSRYALLKHGLKVSLFNLPVMAIIILIESNENTHFIETWPYFVSALFSGILAAIITSFILPLFESIFDITTHMKLLELSNMNHPALKELMLSAPGSYHHSIMVGNLAESAALKIGVDPLLSRVASYYHDLGKGMTPEFFIENTPRFVKGPHVILNDPYQSARIIIDHVENGGKIAKKYKVGKAITDILLQHHGTTQVKFFYLKAVEEVGGDESKVDKSLFQYPGPKPQSKESALVMLADGSEASTRSLDDPTPEAIAGMVNRVCGSVLNGGQLDESGLTLREYRIAIDNYIEVLTNIHHHRIKYPDQK
ncbi:MAG: putative nucleotidyltransferase with HDIG domain [bacterium]|jgi:putative nucleotidyltransferase with HDIG domain